jgi:hypothetical protein
VVIVDDGYRSRRGSRRHVPAFGELQVRCVDRRDTCSPNGGVTLLSGPWPAAVAEARAELLLAEGDQRAAADALRCAAEDYAVAGQLLNERWACEALERLRRATINA